MPEHGPNLTEQRVTGEPWTRGGREGGSDGGGGEGGEGGGGGGGGGKRGGRGVEGGVMAQAEEDAIVFLKAARRETHV